jgi:hypothetical protein
MRRCPTALVVPVLLALLVTGCAGDGEPPSPGGGTGSGRVDPGTPGSAERRDPLTAGARTPGGPGEAARVLVAATRVLDEPGSSADEVAIAGPAVQLAVRAIGRHPAWEDRVLRRLPPRVRADLRDNLAARDALRSMHPSSPEDLSTELPAWRVVAPPPADRLRRWYEEAERAHGVDWEVLAAVHLVETVFGRIRGSAPDVPLHTVVIHDTFDPWLRRRMAEHGITDPIVAEGRSKPFRTEAGEVFAGSFAMVPLQVARGINVQAFGNERSADFPNLVHPDTGEALAHQFAKSATAERLVSDLYGQLFDNVDRVSLTKATYDVKIFESLFALAGDLPYLTNSSMMAVDFLPEHLVILGGSYIGLEFGQMYRRFGSEVTIIQRNERLVPREDEDVSAAVRDILEAEGIRVFGPLDVEVPAGVEGAAGLKT